MKITAALERVVIEDQAFRAEELKETAVRGGFAFSVVCLAFAAVFWWPTVENPPLPQEQFYN